MMGATPGDFNALDHEKPRHRVTISKSFYMGQTEVTQSQWKSVMGTEPWKDEILVKEGANYPASYVSWEDTQEFCRRLSQKEGRTYRLPTEAEWEYACRAGSETVYSFGDNASKLGDFGWFDDRADSIDEEYAHLVGQKRANDFGLFDMHGNVFEWCSDWYDEDYYKSSRSTDPNGASSGSFRVKRGGSWYFRAMGGRSASRSWHTPTRRSGHLGFRLVSVSQ